MYFVVIFKVTDRLKTKLKLKQKLLKFSKALYFNLFFDYRIRLVNHNVYHFSKIYLVSV